MAFLSIGNFIVYFVIGILPNLRKSKKDGDKKEGEQAKSLKNSQEEAENEDTKVRLLDESRSQPKEEIETIIRKFSMDQSSLTAKEQILLQTYNDNKIN